MAQLGNEYFEIFRDVQSSNTSLSHALIPQGRYLLHIIEIGTKDNSKGTGQYVYVVFEVVAGRYRGSKFMQTFNIIHPNSQASHIAAQKFLRLAKAIGITNTPVDTDQFLHQEVYGDVFVQNNNPDYGPSNQVSRFYPASNTTSNNSDTEVMW